MALQTSGWSRSESSKTNNWPIFTAYRPLNRASKEIRLLRIVGVNDKQVLQCSLQHVSLLNDPQYHALSYYWGAPVPPSELLPIMVDASLVYVRPTTSAFLHSLWAQKGSLTVWLDIICINQDDIPERNHQVSMMGEIFERATGVYTWLGNADADTDFALDTLNGNPAVGQGSHGPISDYVEQILLRPYWTRMWVIQEFVMAQSVTLVCGNKMIPWDLFEKSIVQPRFEAAEHWKRYRRFLRGKRVSPTPLGFDGHSRFDDLYGLMLEYSECRCIDPRDKVYALLGLTPERSLVSADYSLSVADLFFKILSLHPPLAKRPLCERRKEIHFARDPCGPTEAAERIRDALSISTNVLLDSLEPKAEDRLYAWFDHVGSIEGLVESSAGNKSMGSGSTPWSMESNYKYTYKTRGLNRPIEYVPTDADLLPGDLVYESSDNYISKGSTYLIYRPSIGQIVDLTVLAGANYRRRGQVDVRNVLKSCLHGIRICSLSWQPRAQEAGVILLHLSRQAHYILWLQAAEGPDANVLERVNMQTVWPAPECHCQPYDSNKGNDDNENTKTNCTQVRSPEGYLACCTVMSVEKHLRPMSAMMFARPY